MTVLAARDQPTLEDFGGDVWWIVLIKVLGIFVILVLLTLFAIVFERKVVARMQQRIGPNRVGWRGYLQSLADGLKLAFKEDIMPALADKPVYFLAPVIATIPAFVAFSVIPLGPTVSLFGERTPLQLTDAPIGVFIVLACSAMGVYGIVLAGWASNSKYPLLGGLRMSAQMFSYEVFMGLSLMGVVAMAGSFNLREIVEAQRDLWFVVPQFLGFAIFMIVGLAETHRTPFDMPEAESELVAGYHAEYSGMKFGMFFVGEYIGIVLVSALMVVLFFGGWHGPWLPPLVWFALKTGAFLFLFILFRAALPRPRYDQFMAWGWKVLLPLTLLNIVVTGALVLASNK